MIAHDSGTAEGRVCLPPAPPGVGLAPPGDAPPLTLAQALRGAGEALQALGDARYQLVTAVLGSGQPDLGTVPRLRVEAAGRLRALAAAYRDPVLASTARYLAERVASCWSTAGQDHDAARHYLECAEQLEAAGGR